MTTKAKAPNYRLVMSVIRVVFFFSISTDAFSVLWTKATKYVRDSAKRFSQIGHQ